MMTTWADFARTGSTNWGKFENKTKNYISFKAPKDVILIWLTYKLYDIIYYAEL